MTAFFISTWTVKDHGKFQEYVVKAEASFVPHGGERLVWGKLEAVLAGDLDYQDSVVVRFPTLDALHAWHDSDAYQAAIPIRDEAVIVTVAAYTAHK